MLALVVCLVLANGGTGRGDEVTGQYFEQLRQRRLFSLAEGYCLQRLADENLPPARRVELTLELSRTFAEHARYTAGAEQAELWERAAKILDDALRVDPRNPRRAFLDVQRAFLPAIRGEFLRGQTELFPHNEELVGQARAAFDEAVPRLTELEPTLAEQVSRATGRRGAGPDVPAAWELRTLQYSVRYQLGAALLERAKLYPAGSADRAASILEAEQWLRRLAGGVPGEELTWNSQVLLAEAARLRGDLRQAGQMLGGLERDGPPQSILDRVTAQKVLVLLDAGRPDEAAKLTIEYRQGRGGLPGELRFVQTKTLIALWEIADANRDRKLADELFGQIENHVTRADLEVGGYWGHRCRLLLDMLRESREYGSELAPLVRAARASYLAGETERAIEEYGRAVVAAVQARRDDLTGALAFTRASILLQAERYEEAGDAFGELIERFPEGEQTAEADLLRAWSLGRLYDQSRTRSRREAYTEALVSHRERFAGQPTAFEATWMLALLEEARLQGTRALELYREIPADHRRGPEAQVAVARCFETLLGRVRELNQPLGPWEQSAFGQLGRYVARFPAEPEPLTLPQAELALRFARIRLNAERPDYRQADELLARVFSTWEVVQAERSTWNGRDSVGRISESVRPPGGRTSKSVRPDADGFGNPSYEDADGFSNPSYQETADGLGSPSYDSSQWKGLMRAVTQLRIVSLAGQGKRQQAEELLAGLSGIGASELLGVLDGLMQLGENADGTTRRGLGELQLQAAETLDRRRGDLEPNEQQRLDRCLAQAYLATNQPRRASEFYESLLARTPKDRGLLRTTADLLAGLGTPEAHRKAKAHWRTLESLEKPGGRRWLEARYQVARSSYALGEYDECRKLLGVTRLLYPDLGGEDLSGRFAELQRAVEEKRR